MLAAACAPQHDVVSSGQARFSEFPEPLYAAVQAACAGPAQSFSRPEPGIIECRELLSPDVTAAVILGLDGTIEDLPELVIRFSATEALDGIGYMVKNDIFLNVPRKDASTARVGLEDRRMSRTINALYRKAGGTPI